MPTNRRKAYRKACFMVTDFTVRGRFYSGYLMDISVNGAFIENRSKASVGDEIQLSFINPEISRPMKISGEIARTCQKGFGVKFHKYYSAQNEMLEVLLHRMKGGWL